MPTSVGDEENDAGPQSLTKGRASPQRLCIASRTVKPIGDMIRFVIGPERDLVPDLKRNLPGRGVWVGADKASITSAIKAKAFVRAFKAEVKVPPDLVERIGVLLERSALDALAICAKAGQVLAGFGKVETALITGAPVIAVLHAADAQADGVRKIAAAVRNRLAEGPREIPILGGLTSAQLDLALGRSNVIHAALLAGPASDGFLARCRRLEGFRAA